MCDKFRSIIDQTTPTPLIIVEVLKNQSITAQCYVNSERFEGSGTAISFIVAGVSIRIDGSDTFNMEQIQKDGRILNAMVNEAKTAHLFLVN